MSRFKSERNAARSDRVSSHQQDPVDGAAAEGASGAGEASMGAAPVLADHAVPSHERSGSGRHDPLWVPGPEVASQPRRPEPPAIQTAVHELLKDAPVDARLVMLRDPDSTQSASFRVLRHHLAEAGAPQVIAVTSPRQRERKTTCALNLAVAIAESGQSKVLLVDANRMRPEIAHILRFVPPRCFFAQVEEHRGEPQRAWKVVDIPELGLHVLGIDSNSDRRPLLDAPGFALAFEGLRLSGYDHIVVDASSVLRSADLNVLQDAADAVLFTAVKRRSTARDLRAAVEQLTPAKILGTTFFES